MANLEQPFIPVGVAIARTASGEMVYPTEAQTRFYLSLWNRTGYAPGVSVDDLELLQALLGQTPPQAAVEPLATSAGIAGALLAQHAPEAPAESLAAVALMLANAAMTMARSNLHTVHYGVGAPTVFYGEDHIYFDTTGSPYAGYVEHVGAWHAFT